MQKEVKEISTEEFLEMVKSREEFMIFVDSERMERFHLYLFFVMRFFLFFFVVSITVRYKVKN